MHSLMSFLQGSPNAMFAVHNMAKQLLDGGYEELPLRGAWTVHWGGRYFVRINDSALIAFALPEQMPDEDCPFYRIISAHTDQPCLRIKPSPQMKVQGYCKLNDEDYGGPIYSTWLDRPLSLAGRLTLRSKDPFYPEVRLIDFQEPILIIPNMAIHLNREVNSGYALNPQVDLLPVGACVSELETESDFFWDAVKSQFGISPAQILDFDLFTYVTEPPQLVGFEREFLSASRLDDLSLVWAGVSALMEATPQTGVNVLGALDLEVVGSRTPQGAASAMFGMIMEKMSAALGRIRTEYMDDLVGSFMISADVAHAVHPNHPEKHDPVCRPVLNGGPVIKLAAGQSYMTQSNEYAVYQSICEDLHIPVQKFVNRSDMRGGSTLGPVMAANFPCRILDMGIPILSMHSARELMGVQDFKFTKSSFIGFYNL